MALRFTGLTVRAMRTRLGWLNAVLLLFAGSAALASPAAWATPTASCEFHPQTGELVVGREGLRRYGVTITTRDQQVLVEGRDCGATVKNTDLIRVIGGGAGDTAYFNLRKGPLAPGMTREAEGRSEIEINLDGFGGSVLDVRTTSAGDDMIIAGSRGVELNGDGDLDYIGVFGTMDFRTHGGSDSLSSLGGQGTGAPVADSVSVLAGPGQDRASFGAGQLVGFDGGSGDDRAVASGAERAGLSGDLGDDVLIGSSGEDYLRPGAEADIVLGMDGRDYVLGTDDGVQGDDVISGGGGIDTFSAGADDPLVPFSVRLDGLPNDGWIGERDNIAEFEWVLGTSADDTLVGNDRGNVLIGYAGDDDITGGHGRDRLVGGQGNDVFHAADGRVDRIWGGKQEDTATDRDDVDNVRDVEVL